MVRKPLAPSWTLDFGFDVDVDRYEVEAARLSDPDEPREIGYRNLFTTRNDVSAGTWVGLDYHPSPAVSIRPGLRADGFLSGTDRAWSVDPRLLVVVAVHPRVKLLHAIGTAHQRPSYLVPVPGIAPATLGSGLQRSILASAGIEIALPLATTLQVRAFDNLFFDLTDPLATAATYEIPHELPRSDGSSKGVEIYLRRPLSKRVGGFLSYTLSRTTRSIEGRTFVTSFDRTHVFGMALGYDFGGGFLGGTRLNVLSGGVVAPLAAEPRREPTFHRLDFRFEKRWRLPHDAFISLVVEMINATFQRQPQGEILLPPVSLPSIGLEGGL